MDKRTLKVVAVSAGIVFPHAVQAIQITRKSHKLTGKKWRTEVIYAVTSLAHAQATDAELAAFIRGHYELGVDTDRRHRLPAAFTELARAI